MGVSGGLSDLVARAAAGKLHPLPRSEAADALVESDGIGVAVQPAPEVNRGGSEGASGASGGDGGASGVSSVSSVSGAGGATSVNGAEASAVQGSDTPVDSDKDEKKSSNSKKRPRKWSEKMTEVPELLEKVLAEGLPPAAYAHTNISEDGVLTASGFWFGTPTKIPGVVKSSTGVEYRLDNGVLRGPAPEMSMDMERAGIDLTPYKDFARERLGFEFHNIGLLVTALTHRSYVNEHKLAMHEHNERLEFLGDAVLEVVTSDFLFRNFAEQEGVMTSLRAALVRTESIGQAGYDLGYEPLVRLSKGEQHGTDRAHEVIMADCFEAVIGAIFIDQGPQAAKDFIYKHILSKIDIVLEEATWRDAKSYMQELSQKVAGVTPVYHTLREEGPDHNKTFVVGLYVGEDLIGMGEGHSKQDAQVMAARMGVKKYRKMADQLGIIV